MYGPMTVIVGTLIGFLLGLLVAAPVSFLVAQRTDPLVGVVTGAVIWGFFLWLGSVSTPTLSDMLDRRDERVLRGIRLNRFEIRDGVLRSFETSASLGFRRPELGDERLVQELCLSTVRLVTDHPLHRRRDEIELWSTPSLSERIQGALTGRSPEKRRSLGVFPLDDMDESTRTTFIEYLQRRIKAGRIRREVTFPDDVFQQQSSIQS